MFLFVKQRWKQNPLSSREENSPLSWLPEQLWVHSKCQPLELVPIPPLRNNSGPNKLYSFSTPLLSGLLKDNILTQLKISNPPSFPVLFGHVAPLHRLHCFGGTPRDDVTRLDLRIEDSWEENQKFEVCIIV